MRGPRVTGRRLACVAAFAAVTVVVTGLIEPPAQADTGAQVVGAISREGAALAAGGERLSDLTRPRARTVDNARGALLQSRHFTQRSDRWQTRYGWSKTATYLRSC